MPRDEGRAADRTCLGLGFLGVAVDRAANEEGSGDRDISPPRAAVRVLVIEAREDLEMARQVRAVLGATAG